MNLKTGFCALLISAVILQTGLIAQETVAVSGKVTDIATGLPLQNVEIRELNATQSVLTCIAGNYKIESNSSGNVILLFSHPDYGMIIRRISVEGDTGLSLDIELAEDLQGLSEIVTPAETVRRVDVFQAIPVKTLNIIPFNTSELLPIQNIFIIDLPTKQF